MAEDNFNLLEALKADLLFELMDNMPTIAYYCALNFNCLYVNKAFTNFTGMTVQELTNFKWKGTNLVHPEDVVWTTEAREKAIETHETYCAEYRMMTTSGEYHWVKSTAFFVKDKQGNPYAWFGNIEDINEYKCKIADVITNLQNNLHEMKTLREELKQLPTLN